MSQPQLCKKCHRQLDPAHHRCTVCGTPTQFATGRLLRRSLAGIAGLLIVILLAAVLWRSFLSPPAKDDRVAVELTAGLDRPALELPGIMRVMYLDLGNKIEISIISKSNPTLYVDTNQDHVLNKGDISYAPLPENHVCVMAIGLAENTVCGTVGSSATVHVTHVGDVTTATWSIPKAELSPGKDFADIVIKTFHENTQRGEYYPAEPFQKVYRLVFRHDNGPESNPGTNQERLRTAVPSEPPNSIPPSSSLSAPRVASQLPAPAGRPSSPTQPPQIAGFEAVPNVIQLGAATRLKWMVTGPASSIQIQPEIGIVAPQGERDVAPSATTRYLLTVKSPAGAVSRELTIAVGSPPPPAIVSFSADAAAVEPGATARLRWNVTGIVASVKLDPIAGVFPATGSRDVTVNQTTNFILTAVGPGGSISDSITVRAVPLSPTITFISTPASTTHPGDPVDLHWAVTGSTHISIQPGFGDVAPNGSEVLHPLVTTQYTLRAGAPGGTVSRTVTVNVSEATGPSHGQLIWTGEVSGTQLITIDRDHADVGNLQGSLPGTPCIVQPVNPKTVSIASSPGPRNQYQRLVVRVKGNGPATAVINWALQ